MDSKSVVGKTNLHTASSISDDIDIDIEIQSDKPEMVSFQNCFFVFCKLGFCVSVQRSRDDNDSFYSKCNEK